MYKNIFIKLFVVLTCAGLFVSCELFKGPDFSNTPFISFDRIDDSYRGITTAGALADSIVIVIKFRDGDGNLGLTSEDRDNPPFQLTNPDGTPNRYYYNYIVRVFRKTNGVFNEVTFNPPYSGAFPPLSEDGKPGPIEGDIEYGVAPFFRAFTPPNDTLKFEIQIIDRALNESNIIETSEVVLNQR